MNVEHLTRHLISYPKSGRTWLRYKLVLLEVAQHVDFQHDGFEFNDGKMPPHDFDVERRLLHYAHVDRIVYLERDPRAIMVSLYHQVTGRFRDFFQYDGTISEFLRHDYFGACNLKRFRDVWAEMARRRDVLRVSYEDMHADPAANLCRVLDYFALPATDARIATAINEARFDKMKEIEQSQCFAKPWLKLRNGFPKVRKGHIEGFREELSDDDIAFLNTIFGIPE